jgi:SRSO17 transposase
VRGVALMDCAYGSDLSLRRRLTALELVYAVGVRARTLVCKAERGDAEPVATAELASSLSKRAWRTIGWRDGTNTPLSSRFARVRAAGEGTSPDEPEKWLIVE